MSTDELDLVAGALQVLVRENEHWDSNVVVWSRMASWEARFRYWERVKAQAAKGHANSQRLVREVRILRLTS